MNTQVLTAKDISEMLMRSDFFTLVFFLTKSQLHTPNWTLSVWIPSCASPIISGMSCYHWNKNSDLVNQTKIILWIVRWL